MVVRVEDVIAPENSEAPACKADYRIFQIPENILHDNNGIIDQHTGSQG